MMQSDLAVFIKKGDTVRVLKGAVVYYSKNKTRLAGRDQEVEIYAIRPARLINIKQALSDSNLLVKLNSMKYDLKVLEAQSFADENANVAIDHPHVVWVGTGGYLFETSIKNVESV